MSYTTLTVNGSWPSAALYTAGADIDVALSNGSKHDTVYAIDASKPTLDTDQGLSLPAGEDRAFQMLSGEKLWIVADGIPDSIKIILHT